LILSSAIGTHDQRIPTGPGKFATHADGDVLHPARENRTVLADLKRTMGTYDFSAQDLQQPAPAGGTLIKWEWFQTYDRRPVFNRSKGHRITMSWDTASKVDELANYSVGQTWHWTPEGYFLIGLIRKKLDFPDLKRFIIDMAEEQDARTILIEDKGSGIGIVQELKRHRWQDFLPSIIAIAPKDDKVMRMHAQTVKLEGGQVFLPARAEWLDDFKGEVCAFPNGKHDDQVDAMSQYLLWEDERQTPPVTYGSR
jgi:predicted phage terminase large subunit-like protein